MSHFQDRINYRYHEILQTSAFLWHHQNSLTQSRWVGMFYPGILEWLQNLDQMIDAPACQRAHTTHNTKFKKKDKHFMLRSHTSLISVKLRKIGNTLQGKS